MKVASKLSPLSLLAGVVCVTASGAELQLEEVLVTAQKRQESLQEVPVAISALSTESIDKANIAAIDNLSNAISGISVFNTGQYVTPVVRGVGTVVAGSATYQAVATYVDDVYIPRAYHSNFSLEDVQSLQLLKGPQGALYGRNATSGAIVITTKNPEVGGDLEGNLNVDLGEFKEHRIGARIAKGLGDKAAFSLNGYYHENDGIHDIAAGSQHRTDDEHFGQRRDWTIAAKFRLQPTENVDIVAKYQHAYQYMHWNVWDNYGDSEFPGAAQIAQIDPLTAPIAAAGGLSAYEVAGLSGLNASNLAAAGLSSAQIQWAIIGASLGLPVGSVGTPFTALDVASQMSFGNEFGKVYENIINPCEIGTATGFRAKCRPANFVDTVIDQYSIKGVFQFKRFELVSISAYEESASNSAASVDDVDPLSAGAQTLTAIGLPNLGLGFYGEFELENYQQELRLASNETWDWQWIVGLQYFKEKATGHRNWTANFGTVTLQTDNPWSNESASIFAQATVPITDHLSFTLGGRHIEDEYKLRDELDYSDPLVNPAFGGVSFGKLKRTESFDTFTTRLEYKRDDWLVYGGVSSGFKAGSLNNDGPRYGEAKPEELISYEVGFKSEWNAGRLQVNGSVFYYDYKDPHVTFIDNSVGGTRLFNIPDAEVYGADLDLTGLVSQQLSWFMNMTALHAEYTSDATVNLSIGPALLDTKGKRMGGTPKFQLAAGFDWFVPILESAEVVFTPTVAYNSGIWFDPENRSGSGKDGVSDDGYTILNLNLRYKPTEANWKASIWVKNALNEDYNRGGAAAGLLLFGWAGDPRQAGISFSYDF